jgi:hypothetical protein
MCTDSLSSLCSTSKSGFRQDRHLVTNRIRSASAALLFLGGLVTLTSAFNLPNRSPSDSLFVDHRAVPFKSNAATAAARIPLTSTGPGWSIVQSPNNGSPGTNELFATTCTSSSDCWAVGYSDIGSGYNTLIERWNGAAWAIVSSPNNSGNNILYGVTCTSTLDCWAVGTYFDDDLFQRTLIEHWNGDVWSIVSSPNRGLSSPPIDVLSGVACISASECWAAGSNDDRNGVGQTLIQRWDGMSWTIVDSPNPSGSNGLFSVTCAPPSPQSESECWAVGETDTGLGRTNTLIEKWDGAVWSLVSSPNSGNYNDLRGVTCPSASECWAAGTHSGATNFQTLIEHWNGMLWDIVSSPNTSTTQDNFLLYGLTCTSASECWAVGYYVNDSRRYQTLIERWDGTSWVIVTSPNTGATQDNLLNGVTCASASECWAAGYYAGSGPPQTLVEEYALTIPPLTGVGSRMTHGSAGSFDIDLPLVGQSGVECRSGGTGGNYKVVFSFANTVTNCGTPGTPGGSVTNGPNPNQCTEDLTGVSNAQYVGVALNNVLDSENNTGNVSVPMGVLIGDVNGNAIVNASDVSLTKSEVGNAVSGSNFREDVNANGAINSVDVALVKSKVGTALPP